MIISLVVFISNLSNLTQVTEQVLSIFKRIRHLQVWISVYRTLIKTKLLLAKKTAFKFNVGNLCWFSFRVLVLVEVHNSQHIIYPPYHTIHTAFFCHSIFGSSQFTPTQFCKLSLTRQLPMHSSIGAVVYSRALEPPAWASTSPDDCYDALSYAVNGRFVAYKGFGKIGLNGCPNERPRTYKDYMLNEYAFCCLSSIGGEIIIVAHGLT